MEVQRAGIMRQFWDNINSGRYYALERLIAADYVDHFPQSGVTTAGREGVKQTFRLQHLGLALPHYVVESTLNDEDMVATRFTVCDAGTGAAGEYTPPNLRLELHGLYLCRINNGCITEGGAIFDDMPVLKTARSA